jgi:hypothetical protein
MVEVGGLTVVVDVGGSMVVVEVDDVDEFVHDAKTNDVTKRQVRSIKKVPLFIPTSINSAFVSFMVLFFYLPVTEHPLSL